MITVIDMKTMREEGLSRARQELDRNLLAANAALSRGDAAEFERLMRDRKLIRRDMRKVGGPVYCPAVL